MLTCLHPYASFVVDGTLVKVETLLSKCTALDKPWGSSTRCIRSLFSSAPV